jgi:AcrR family transcriptional regulator
MRTPDVKPSGATVEGGKLEPRRAEVLDMAAELFATQGYHATSMRDLAGRLQIKAGSLYYHIVSKDQLLDEICAISLQEVIRSVDAAIAAHQTLADQIRAIIRGHAQVLQRFHAYLVCYQAEYIHLPPEPQARSRVELAKFHRKLEGLVEAARADGTLRADVEARTARLAIVAVMTQLSKLDPRRFLAEAADGLADILVAGLTRS